jgi:hypothetical protein
MSGLSDTILAGAAMPALESVHAETIMVLTGADAGNSFTAIQELEPDITFQGETDEVDRRSKRILRFTIRPGNCPNLQKLDKVQTSDGRRWTATIRPGNNYLTVDYELSELVNGVDT